MLPVSKIILFDFRIVLTMSYFVFFISLYIFIAIVWQCNGVFLMGEIGTDKTFGDKTGGDRPREHCIA
jgi:hypothetical protein